MQPTDTWSKIIFSLKYSWATFTELFWYVIAGIVVAAICAQILPHKRIREFIVKKHHLALFTSSLIGAVSPLCTYGAIPLVCQLMRHGVPISILIAFLSASSLINPQLFVLTAGVFGYQMAIFRVITSILFGVMAGYMVSFLPTSWTINMTSLESELNLPGKNAHHHHSHNKKFSIKQFFTDLMNTSEFILFYFVLGVFLAGIFRYFIPPDLVRKYVGSGKWYSIALSGMLGVPFYACGGAVLPLLRTMVEMGMTTGAALAFMTSGPATRITPLLALATVMSKRAVICYVLLIFLIATIFGYIYDIMPTFIPMPEFGPEVSIPLFPRSLIYTPTPTP